MFDRVIDVARIFGEDELIVIAPRSEYAGHAFVGQDPVVHVVAHDVGVEEIAVAYLHPDSDGFGGSIGDEVLVELPCAVRGGRVGGPLLVDVGAGVGEDAVVELGVVPRHDEGAGASGAAAHGGPAVGVSGELDVVLLFDAGEDFVLDEVGVTAGHGVVFEAALAALRVAAAVADGDGDHDGETVLRDEVVEGGEEGGVGAIGSDDEGCNGAGYILFGDVDRYLSGVGCGVAGGDDEPGGIFGVGGSEGAGVAGDAGIEFAVGGVEGELVYGSLREVGLRGGFGRRRVGWSEDEVAVRVRGRVGGVG